MGIHRLIYNPCLPHTRGRLLAVQGVLQRLLELDAFAKTQPATQARPDCCDALACAKAAKYNPGAHPNKETISKRWAHLPSSLYYAAAQYCSSLPHSIQEPYLKAPLLGCITLGCFVLLLALLGHRPRQLLQQRLCHDEHPASGGIPGLDIDEVGVHT